MDSTLQAWLLILSFTLGALILVGGALGVLLLWFVWGRDRPVRLPTDYLNAPPSDLPPGIVAYLVNEKPSARGVLADVLHLATLGLISVDLREADPPVTLNWRDEIAAGAAVQWPDGQQVELAEHERTLFNAIRQAAANRPETTFTLSMAMAAVQPILATVYEQMGRQTSAFFSMRPSVARQRWQVAGWTVLVGAIMLCCPTFAIPDPYGWLVLPTLIALALVGVMLIIVARWMPRRTTKGAEEAARWQAFQRYLENLKRYGDLEQAQRIIDQAFPYAVALGVEQVVLRQAAELGAQSPVWLLPMTVSVGRMMTTAALHRPPLGAGFVTPGRLEQMLSKPSPGLPLPTAARPQGVSLDEMSRQVGSSFDRASAALGAVLDAAAGGGSGDLFSTLGKILEEEASGGSKAGVQPKSSGGWRSSSWSSGKTSRSSSWRPSGGSRSSGGFKSGGSRSSGGFKGGGRK